MIHGNPNSVIQGKLRVDLKSRQVYSPVIFSWPTQWGVSAPQTLSNNSIYFFQMSHPLLIQLGLMNNPPN